MDIQKFSYNSKEYPYLLRQIADSPESLYCIGDVSLLKKRCIAIVGSREPTKYGRSLVEYILKRDVLPYDIAIVSGLARGIDTLVHERCLELGISTIAVVAGGLDRGYPMKNQKLFEDITKEGLVMAEYPVGTVLEKYMFAKRNRIMVGISEAVVIPEAKRKGGSMVTAQLALDSNREVYTVPGDVYRKTSQGCNALVREGANVILDRLDFIEILENEQRRFYI